MSFPITHKHRARIVGLLIILAYAMLTYTITGNKPLGVITDILSGLAVIGIPLLMLPLFGTGQNKRLNTGYVAARSIEGLLMIIGGLFILVPSLEGYRNDIYQYVQIHFFIAGALLFYLLLYKTRVVPRFIALWGLLATTALLGVTILGFLDINAMALDVLVLPLILNELFLAIWLMVKGFAPARHDQ